MSKDDLNLELDEAKELEDLKGGKLNIQALSRRSERLMRPLIADEGHTLVSIDLSSGEPTCSSHYSKDYYYKAFCFDMVGKAPYYDDNGVLMIDDIYLACMSVSPMGKAKIRALFDSGVGGLSFADQWLKDADVIKKILKEDRAFHKILVLGIGYAMGPRKMVKAAYNSGFTLSLADAKAFYKAYWDLFQGLKRFGKSLEQRFEQNGYLVNEFGYRIIPDNSYKAMNYWIQSTVSGIMAALCAKFFAVYNHAEFVTIVHDEAIISVPYDRLEEAKKAWFKCLESLNAELEWSVKIRCGWVEGQNFFEAK